MTDMKVLNESLEHVNVVGLLYDLSAVDSFRFAADLYVSGSDVSVSLLSGSSTDFTGEFDQHSVAMCVCGHT